MKHLYLDCVSGISGDMTLSALIDLGADLDYIRGHLKQLPIDPFTMDIKQVNKRGISAKLLQLHFESSCMDIDRHTKYGHEHSTEQDDGSIHGHCHEHGHSHEHDYHHSHGHSDEHTHGHTHSHEPLHGHSHNHVHRQDDSHHHGNHIHSHHHGDHNHSHHHEHRKASTILNMIRTSGLPERVKQRSMAVFQVIAEAEGKIHGMRHEEVHFHEVGAMDSIIDIIGVCLALESLGVEKITASPVPTGYGKVLIAHGLYPIPAPATAEILTGVPLADFHAEGELTTPTGAGFVKALAEEYGRLPALPMKKIGYGAGKKDFEHPNVLRAILFEHAPIVEMETIGVLECQLDDMTGEMLGYVMEKVLAKNALDVYFTHVIMKKSRPGILLTVLASLQHTDEIERLLLNETSTFGVRKSEWSRKILQRTYKKVSTPFGEITVKVGFTGNSILKMTPEYEEVKNAAILKNISFMEVYASVQSAAREQIINLD
ncbi:nickel pincer cofactor biosynthesis protein LarC [Bacillus sp. B-jedd]|uniref:nickel pincer cofactor biosynthesis protein LarC n=1 Tax=Bacillus sp. B-jedd TaxID=1476857 RepID=UPI0005156F9C|nr:nickel pincer cofactor biosynthesis protein LarC [Bacillus sp. B-jedd]CEG28664.1 hypothetical protein BN1002_03587 [Bacillus sp. B-jedd]